MDSKTNCLECFAYLYLLYHRVYLSFIFNNSPFNLHTNHVDGYSKVRRVLSEHLELSYFMLGLRIPSYVGRIPLRYLERTENVSKDLLDSFIALSFPCCKHKKNGC